VQISRFLANNEPISGRRRPLPLVSAVYRAWIWGVFPRASQSFVGRGDGAQGHVVEVNFIYVYRGL
jgi:hypothetical protein